MIFRLYILLVSYFLLTWLSGYFGRKVINKLDLTRLDNMLLANIDLIVSKIYYSGSTFTTPFASLDVTHWTNP